MTVDLTSHRRVHFVGIGGIGMSALARHLLATGYIVSGSDRSPGEQGEALAGLGATVYTGHSADHLDGSDLVVVTSAAQAGNPEVDAARAGGVPVVKRAELLASILNPRRGVAVAGTHGKTTTSALLGHILTKAGLDPTILIGGVSADLGSNARVGGDLVVAEADEYDRSFLHLHPAVAIITNVEAEHLDIYGTEEAVCDAFRTFASQVTELVVACADDDGAMRAAECSPAALVTYGIGGGNWRAVDVEFDSEKVRFTARRDSERFRLESPLAGRHNVLNVLAAVAAARWLDVDSAAISASVAGFSGVARRTEVIGEAGGVTVVDDYAHHPSEIRTVLAGIRTRWKRPIRVVFQPHTYSRTRDFLTDFATAFGDADAVYVLDIYSARETDTLGVSSQSLVSEMSRHHASVTYLPDPQAVISTVARDARPGDLVVTMGAGDVYRLAPGVLEALA